MLSIRGCERKKLSGRGVMGRLICSEILRSKRFIGILTKCLKCSSAIVVMSRNSRFSPGPYLLSQKRLFWIVTDLQGLPWGSNSFHFFSYFILFYPSFTLHTLPPLVVCLLPVFFTCLLGPKISDCDDMNTFSYLDIYKN